MITLTIDNISINVDDDTTVAAAILNAGIKTFRRSIGGESRGPLCGMGICSECRVTINDVPHQPSCNVLVTEGMKVVTGE